ncbi:MAG: HpcH/HpaI aldolase/citrate lyase family protein [Oxalobacteraceae bacterium]
MHPSEVLFQGKHRPLTLPVCDHYAGSEKLMRKSLALQQELGPVFDITFDCEDGAAAGDELAHARLVGELIAGDENPFGRIGARVHDAGSPHFEQDVATLCALAAPRLAYLVIPKIDGRAQLDDAVALVSRHASAAGRQDLPVHVLIETHSALHQVWEIAEHPAVECLSFGIMDFVSAHYGAIPGDAMRSPEQFSHPLITRAKLEIAAACHANAKVPSHNVCTEIRDVSVVASDARLASRQFGYQRMWSIHPDQIRPILGAFAPEAGEIEDATAILLAAQDKDWGPIRHKSKLHDRASYRYYWTVLQRARQTGQMLPKEADGLL